MKYFLFCCLGFVLYGCQKDSLGNGQMDLVWSEDNPYKQLAGCWEPIIYKDMAVFGWNTYDLVNPHNMPIEARDLETGTVKWTWNDYFTDEKTGSGISASYPRHVFNNILVFSLRTALYAIDLETGKTLWRKKVELSEVFLRSLGSDFFDAVHNLERTTYHIVKGDTWTGQLDTVFSYTEDAEHVPNISVPYPYINDVGDTMLVFTNIAYKLGDPLNGKKEIYFYNMSADTLSKKYENTLNASSGWGITVQGTKVFLQGIKFACYDGNTYQKLWERDNPKSRGTIGTLCLGGLFIYGTEGSDQDLFAVDIETGHEIWRAPGAGTCGLMSHYNGVIYFNSGGDGKMHCIEAASGTVLGEFEAPGRKKNSDDFFTAGLSIDSATGRVYTASFLSAYCFEPLR